MPFDIIPHDLYDDESSTGLDVAESFAQWLTNLPETGWALGRMADPYDYDRQTSIQTRRDDGYWASADERASGYLSDGTAIPLDFNGY
jgi:hypothetical protein